MGVFTAANATENGELVDEGQLLLLDETETRTFHGETTERREIFLVEFGSEAG